MWVTKHLDVSRLVLTGGKLRHHCLDTTCNALLTKICAQNSRKIDTLDLLHQFLLSIKAADYSQRDDRNFEMAVLSQPQHTLMSMPTEIRLNIYEHVYYSSSASVTELLSFRVPQGQLRLVSRQVYVEGKLTFEHAAIHHDRRRQCVFRSMYKCFDKEVQERSTITSGIIRPALTSAILTPRRLTKSLHRGKGLCGRLQLAHVPGKCFNCGKLLALALWCTLYPRDTPTLVQPESSGKPTGLGVYLATINFDQLAQGGDLDFKWSMRWWYEAFKVQALIDLRCCIMRSAVESYYQLPLSTRPAFTTANLMEFQVKDERWPKIVQLSQRMERAAPRWEQVHKLEAQRLLRKAKAKGHPSPPLIPELFVLDRRAYKRSAGWESSLPPSTIWAALVDGAGLDVMRFNAAKR